MATTLAPDARLLQQYGSEFYEGNLRKLAVPLGIRGSGGLLTSLMLDQESQYISRQAEEAALLTEHFRRLEQMRQMRMLAGFTGRGPALSYQGDAVRNIMPMMAYQRAMSLPHEGMTRYASAAAGSLAKMATVPLEKRAIGIFKAIGGLLGRGAQTGAQVGAKTVAKTLPMGAVGTQAARSIPKTMPMAAVAPALPSVPAAASAVTAPAAAPQLRGRLSQLAQSTQQGLSAAGQRVGKALTPGWQTKALVGGTLAAGSLGALSLGHHGISATRDFMLQPEHASPSWGHQGLGMATDVNQYGYSDVVR